MIDHCSKNKGKITHCIVFKVDRLARKSEYHHIIKATLAKHGVKLVSVTEPIGDDPMGNLMDGMLAAFAQFDNEIRLARTTGGMKARTEQGGWPHDAPVGYIKHRTASGASTIKPDPATAETVTRLLRTFATGDYSVKDLADLAYEQGLTAINGKKRRWQTVKNMLENPIYAGYVRSKYTDGKMIKGLHPGLIDDTTYYRIQSALSGHSKGFSRQPEKDWPLRGGFLRHTCGKPMTGSAPMGNSGPSPRYSCIHCRSSIIGKRVSTGRVAVHEDFVNLLNDVKATDGITRLFKEIILKKWNAEFDDAIKHTSKIEAEINSLLSKKSKILELYIAENITTQEKDMKMREVGDELVQLKAQRLDAEEYVHDKEAIIDAAMLFMENPAVFWNLGSIEVKRRVQDLVFPEGLTYDCVDGFRTPVLSNSYLLIRKIASGEAKNPNLVAASGLEPLTPGL